MGQTVNIRSYRDLEVWQKSVDFVVDCYDVANKLPRNEIYGLASQLQRAAVSVPANIAEGHERSHTREFLNHLSIAYGSLMEIEMHLQIAARLRYIDYSTLEVLLNKSSQIGRMLSGLIQSLNRIESSLPSPPLPPDPCSPTPGPCPLPKTVRPDVRRRISELSGFPEVQVWSRCWSDDCRPCGSGCAVLRLSLCSSCRTRLASTRASRS
jgi:four helix bundle protein